MADDRRALDVAGPMNDRPTNVRWIVFALCCGTSWLLYLHRYIFSLILPDLAAQWQVDKATLGVLTSAFYLSYLLCQVPSGLIADLVGVRGFLAVMILGWSLCLGLHAWAPTVAVMIVIRLAFGATQAAGYPNLNKVTGVWFPRSVRTTLQGWIASFFGRSGGFSANILFATVLVGWLGLDWRVAVISLALLGVIFAAVFWLFFRNRPDQHPWVNEAERRLITAEDLPLTPSSIDGGEKPKAAAARLRELWNRTSGRSLGNLGFLLTQHFMACFADAIYVAWLPTILTDEHGVDKTWMGIYSALPLLGGAIGGVAGGVINDAILRWTGSRRWARSATGGIGNAMAFFLFLLAIWQFDSPARFSGLLFLVKFFADWGQPTVWGTITDIGGRAVATVFGILNGVGGIGGLIAPALFGAMADRGGWYGVFGLVAGGYFLCAVAWVLVDANIPVVREPHDGSA